MKDKQRIKLPSVKFDIIPSTSGRKSSIRMDKQCDTQGSTKFLQRSYRTGNMNSNTDRVVANLNQEDIINNYNN